MNVAEIRVDVSFWLQVSTGRTAAPTFELGMKPYFLARNRLQSWFAVPALKWRITYKATIVLVYKSDSEIILLCG